MELRCAWNSSTCSLFNLLFNMPGYTPNIFNQYIHVAYILFQENFMLKTIHQSGCVKGTPNNKKNAAINFEASQ